MKYNNWKIPVSIVMPVYNGEAFLDEAIQSCLNQSFRDFELIIVDDKSTDTSLAIMEKWARTDNRIRVIKNKQNKKLPGALNIGFSHARGSFYTWTSHDNILGVDFLAVLLNEIQKLGSDIVYSDYTKINETGEFIGPSIALSPEDVPYKGGIGAAFLYRREVHAVLNGYRDNLFLIEDYDFWVRAHIAGFRYTRVSRPDLYYYRLHQRSLSSASRDRVMIKTLQYQYGKRGYLLAGMLTGRAEWCLNLLHHGRLVFSLRQKTAILLSAFTSDVGGCIGFLKGRSRTFLSKRKRNQDNLERVVHVSSGIYPSAASGRLIIAERSFGMDAVGLADSFPVDRIHFPCFRNDADWVSRLLYRAIRFYRKVQRIVLRRNTQNSRQSFRVSDIPWNDGIFGQSVHKTISELGGQIAHLHWIASGFPSLRSLPKIQQPIVWTLHDVWPLTAGHHCEAGCRSCFLEDGSRCTEFSTLKSAAASSQEIWAYKKKIYQQVKSMTIVTPSNWLGEMVRQSPLFINREVVVIPNPVNVHVFCPSDKVAAKRFFGIDPNARVLLFSSCGGTGVSYKGHNLFLTMLQILYGQGLNQSLHVLVVGPCHESEEHYLFPVTFLGFVDSEDQMALVYNATDIFVGPSTQDNFPNVFIEAMACGVPSVGFHVGGIPEIVSHLERGYIASDLDPKDLARGVQWILESPSRYTVLSGNCREFALRELSNDVVAAKYLELYNRILKA